MQVANNALKLFAVKKIIILFLFFGFMLDLTAQMQKKPDTINVNQLYVYKDKAVKEIIGGMIVTFTGVGIAYFGNKIGSEPCGYLLGECYYFIGTYVGIPAAAVGIILMINGGIKHSLVEITIREFNMVHETSVALGVGITFRF